MQQNLLGIMEAMCGVAQSARPDAVQEFYEFLLPLLRVSVPLMELYLGTPDVVTVILELFSLVAENYSAFLDEVGTCGVQPTPQYSSRDCICTCTCGDVCVHVCVICLGANVAALRGLSCAHTNICQEQYR